jgi:hypothetical protein
MSDTQGDAPAEPRPPEDANTPSAAQQEGERAAAAERGGADMPTEEELRDAYAAELRRISSADLILQTAASLINVGAYRLGLTGGESGDRDLDQVRDAIDGVRALLPILERRDESQQLRPLRDALSQLQLAYAREAQGGTSVADAPAERRAPDSGGEPAATDGGEPAEGAEGAPSSPGDARHPGPAESSGRLWIPGKG